MLDKGNNRHKWTWKSTQIHYQTATQVMKLLTTSGYLKPDGTYKKVKGNNRSVLYVKFLQLRMSGYIFNEVAWVNCG